MTLPDPPLELPGSELIDAYSRYNSLLRRLASLERALEHRATARSGPR